MYENFNDGSARVIGGIDRMVSKSGKREIKGLTRAPDARSSVTITSLHNAPPLGCKNRLHGVQHVVGLDQRGAQPAAAAKPQLID
jgi:hypothetical protein